MWKSDALRLTTFRAAERNMTVDGNLNSCCSQEVCPHYEILVTRD